MYILVKTNQYIRKKLLEYKEFGGISDKMSFELKIISLLLLLVYGENNYCNQCERANI